MATDLDRVLTGLAEPTRRRIVDHLRRGPRLRFVAPYGGTLTLEPGVGGRLLHVVDGGVSFVVGRVEVWEPPRRLALTWRLTNFTPEQQTRVDVRFEPAAGGTRVSVTHSGWDAIPAG